jgi:hypothetical protein
MVIRIPRTNWQPYRNGGITILNNYGGSKVISEDTTYVYVEVKLPQGTLDGNYYRPVNRYQWAGGGLTQYASWLNWDPAAVKSPAWGVLRLSDRSLTALGSIASTGKIFWLQICR